MTVQTTDTRVVFQGDGQSTSFPFGFRILEGEHVDVFLTNTTGSTIQGINPGQVRKLQASEFSVTINEPQPGMGDPGVQETPGGTVSLSGFGAPKTGLKVSIERTTPLTQLTDYVPNDPFPADTHERALDKLTVIAQELGRELSDVLITAPPGEDTDCPPLPIASERANSILGFDSSGCPTTLNVDDFDITAPVVLSDLDNVAASNATSRQIISFNAATGDWTPENNVFSLNGLHGDITVSTNSDGGIVVEDGDGNSNTIDTTQVRGSKLLSTFTAAEAIDRGEFVSVRSNGQAELLQEVITSGGPAQTTEVVNNDGFAADAIHFPGTNKFALLYEDSTVDTEVRLIFFEVDPIAEEVSQIGSPQTIVTFTGSANVNVQRLEYDTVNERLLIFLADPDNGPDGSGQPSVIVVEPDLANLSVSATGSLTAVATNSKVASDATAIGFHEGEKTVVVGYPEDFDGNITGTIQAAVFFGVQIDPSNNSVSVGTPVVGPTGDGNTLFGHRFGYSPTNGVLTAVYTSSAADNLRLVAINVSGTSLSFGNVETLTAQDTGGFRWASGLWAENLELGFAVYVDPVDADADPVLRGAVFSLNGDILTIEDDRLLHTISNSTAPGRSFQNWPAYDPANNRWIVGTPDSDAAQAGDSDAAIFTGSIDPSTPKLTFLEGTNDSGSTTLSTVDGDVDTNTSTPTIFDANSGLVLQFYRDNDLDSINVSLGTAPNSSSNRNRWIGTADEDVTAGNDFAVAVRGSDTFVKVSSSLSPGTIYFLGADGSLGSSGGDFRAGVATSTDTLLTAGVDFRDEGGTDSTGTTSSATTEELVETREITSATGTIDLALPTGFVKHRIELLEVQSDSADPSSDNLTVRFSNDGGSSFISSSDYDWVNNIASTGGLFKANDQDATFSRHSPPAASSPAGGHNDYTFWIMGARNANLFTNLRSEEVSFSGGGQGVTASMGTLKLAEDHDALRFEVEGGVNITRAVIRVVGIK